MRDERTPKDVCGEATRVPEGEIPAGVNIVTDRLKSLVRFIFNN